MAIIKNYICKKHKEQLSSSSSPPRYTRLSDKDNNHWQVQKGHVPVLVGEEDGVRERFLIPTHFIAHPSIVSLLESSADEFGYEQEGVIRIPYDPECFREILQSLPSKKIY